MGDDGMALSPDSRIGVLVVDDHAIVRAGICSALKLSDDIDVLGEADDGVQALEFLEKHPVDVVLLDLQMPRMGGFECLDQVRRRWPQIAVVVLTVNEDQETPPEVMRRGASAYVPKYVRPSDLASIVRQVMSRSVLVAAPRVGRLPKALDSAHGGRNPFCLTDRELAVLALVSQGKTNEDVAHELFVSTKTVKFHLSGIFRKLQVRNRTEAAALAISHGLVSTWPLED